MIHIPFLHIHAYINSFETTVKKNSLKASATKFTWLFSFSIVFVKLQLYNDQIYPTAVKRFTSHITIGYYLPKSEVYSALKSSI